ncbi:LuxR C-terminal-related transcriptional regulator [Streptomyces sp. NPDC048496]|uniref:helix-turn-helix transcriptional regulator n=1 Tax=Streptomyces sp. NPDC048496 TaxID=3365558 RepID=UPI0037116173
MLCTERQLGATLPDLGFGEIYGRERELALVREWLDRGQAQARQLTLTGPAGVGKSHLAHAAVTAWAHDAHGPALLWADLADSEDGKAVWTLVGAGTAREAAERVGAAELLLVLDNGDQVVADIALDVAALLRACPLLRVLLTSRVWLDIRAERILPVGPLSTGAGSPAEAIFADRVRPYYRAGVDGGPGQLAVADICRTLDGIPLAIEMAAEAAGTEGPRALLERLKRGESPGRGRPRDIPERHRSMSAALTWASGTLTQSDLALLRHLSVFETHVDLPTVRRVTGLGHAAAVAGIESLVQKSLLLSAPGQDGDPEFRLTHMARCLHHARLASDAADLAGALDRHAAHWSAFATTTATALRAGRHVDQVLHTVAAHLPDILKATRHLAGHGDHIAVLRLLSALEGPLLRQRLAPEAADAIEQAADAWSTAAARNAIEADARGANGTGAQDVILAEAQGIDRVDGQGAVVVEALIAVARWALGHGDHRRAERALDRASAAAAELPAMQAQVTAFTGELLRRRGESTAAAVLLGSAVQRLDAHADRRTAALARRSQALLRADGGDPDAEQPLLHALDDIAEDTALRASLLMALARVRRVLGRNQEAYESAREAARLLVGIADPHQVAEVLDTVAVTFIGGSDDDAQRHAVARVLVYAEAIRRRYGAVADDGANVGVLKERLARSVDAALLRRLRLDAERVSPHDALAAALFATPPAPERSRPGAGATPYGLTPRQYEIALLVAEGLTNRQIARRLGISEWTVTNHLRVVMQKLDCTSRVHVVRVVQGSTA